MKKRQKKKNNTCRKISNSRLNNFKKHILNISIDLASVYNMSAEQAIKKLKQALISEHEYWMSLRGNV